MAQATDRYHGILLLSKPAGITSHTAVDRVRKIVGQQSVGHAGTLDPAAEGLLVLCVGKATKVARFLSSQDKSYEAQIVLGVESATYDAEGVDQDAARAPVPRLDEVTLKKVLSEFKGRIRQKVPAHSAVHVGGKRLYELARKGDAGELPVRDVEVRDIALVTFDPERLDIRVTCSKGTYVRSLAHDIGQRLGCGGYLSFLRRTSSGRFRLDDALSFDDVSRYHRLRQLEGSLLSIGEVLEFSTVTVCDDFDRHVLHGRVPKPINVATVDGAFSPGDRLLVKNSAGSVLAVGTATVSSRQFGRDEHLEILQYDRVLS